MIGEAGGAAPRGNVTAALETMAPQMPPRRTPLFPLPWRAGAEAGKGKGIRCFVSDEGFGVPFPKMFCWEEKSISSVDLSGGAQTCSGREACDG